MPVISGMLPDTVTHHRWGARAALIALLSGLLHDVNPALDYPTGLHPLAPHVTSILAILSSVLLAEGSAAEEPPVAISQTVMTGTSPPDLLSFATDARCIAAAGLCDLLARPPSPLLTSAEMSGLVEGLTTVLLRETDRRCCDAVLRVFCTAAVVRERVCHVVLSNVMPKLLTVVQVGGIIGVCIVMWK